MSPADRGIAAALLDDDRRWHDEAARVALTEPTKRSAPGALLSAVRSALRAIGSPGGAEEHADGSVWLDSLYVESDADAYYVMRERPIAGGAHSDQLGGGFYRRSRGEAWAMRQAASALVREWVREQLDAWVSDDGGGE